MPNIFSQLGISKQVRRNYISSTSILNSMESSIMAKHYCKFCYFICGTSQTLGRTKNYLNTIENNANALWTRMLRSFRNFVFSILCSDANAATQKSQEQDLVVAEPSKDKGAWRDLTAYWIFGLCNNFGYVVMLTAAHDIIKELADEVVSFLKNVKLFVKLFNLRIQIKQMISSRIQKKKRFLHQVRDHAIFLAPARFFWLMWFPDFASKPYHHFFLSGRSKSNCRSLIMKTIKIAYFSTRISISCVVAVCGFVAVAFAQTQWVALGGVALTSFASGLGEPTFLAYSAFFNKNVISTWSSGTGGAGIVGALAYTGEKFTLKFWKYSEVLF